MRLCAIINLITFKSDFEMITCAVCEHSWDAKAGAEQVCPACGQFMGCGETVDGISSFASLPRLDEVPKSQKSEPIDPIGMTIQSDRWVPSSDEIRDIAATVSPEMMHRLTTTGMFSEVIPSAASKEESELHSKNANTVDLLPASPVIEQAPKDAPQQPSMSDASPDRDVAVDEVEATIDGFALTGAANQLDRSADATGATVDNVDLLNAETNASINGISSAVDVIGGTVDSVEMPGRQPNVPMRRDEVVGVDLGATVDSVEMASQPNNVAMKQGNAVGDELVSTVDGTVGGIPGGKMVVSALGATVDGTSGTVGGVDEYSVENNQTRVTDGRSRATLGGSSVDRSTAIGSIASNAAEAASNNQLEKTLVIQPRILRSDNVEDLGHGDRSDYDLLRKLGEGGMGVVFSARQQSIRRVVALKMLKARNTHEVRQRENFLAEAVITGDLEHPNIVPIYDLGRDGEGAIFYSMKCVNGTPWDKLIHEKSQLENLEILMKVADAVAFAHSKNVIHRDLKPENVMLGDFGEVLVMDWGLAISTVTFNRFALGGTPAYMAPEMVLGPANAIGAHSDIYLLGAILYEFVAGHRPHKGASIMLCLMAAGKNEIIPTDKTGELLQIALKAMASDPRDRYVSVRAMQDAIRGYLSHTESIALAVRAQDDLNDALELNRYDSYARALFGFQEAVALWEGNLPAKEGATKAALAYAQCAMQRGDYELGLSLLDPSHENHRPLVSQLRIAQAERDQRNQRLKTARRAGLALVAIIFAIVTTSFFWIRMEAGRARNAEVVAKNQRADALFQKGIAEEQRAKAISARQDEERERVKADAATVAEQAARKLAEKKREEADSARANERTQRTLAEEAQRREQYEGYVAKIGLAAAKIEENAYDRALSLLAECPQELRHWEWGRLNYLCSREIMKFNGGMPLEALAVSPDGEHFAVGGWGDDVLVFAFDQDEPVSRIKTGATQVFALAFSPDGEQLAIGSNERPNFLSIWESLSGKKILGLEGHKDAVLSVVWSSDGKRLLTGSYDHSARLWEVEDGSSKEYLGHDWWVWSAHFSPDEQRMVTSSQDGTAIVWDVQSDIPGPAFTNHGGPVLSARFSPQGDTIASGGYDGRVMLWSPASLRGQNLADALVDSVDLAKPAEVISFSAHSDAVRSIVFSSDGGRLLTAGNDNAVRLWERSDLSMRREFRGHASRVSAAQFMQDEAQVVSAAYDHRVKVWSVPSHREQDVLGRSVLQGHLDSILGASFDPTGKLVVTASRDRSAIAWDRSTGQPIQTFNEGHAYLASDALFIPGGRQVLTVAIDNTARIWDLATGTQAVVLEGTGIQSAAAVAPDGQWIATGSDRKSIAIWNLAGERVREFEGFESDVTALAISPDGRDLLVGDSVGRCRMINAETGQEFWVSRTHSRGVTRVAFVPGEDKVLTASLDHVVSMRDSRTGTEDTTRLLKHSGPVTSLAVSKDGTLAITSCSDNKIRVWNLDDSSLAREIDGGEIACSGVAVSPDSKITLAVMADRKIRMWDVQSGEEIGSPGSRVVPYLNLSQTTIPLWSATFSDNGERLLTVGGTEARIWDVGNGKTLQTFSPQSAVASVHFSPSGDQFVTGSWDNAARIWDTKTGGALIKLGGAHTRFVNASAFSPDGQFVVTASDDRTAGLWDAQTGQLIGRYLGHEGRVMDVAFSPDGLRVLTASDDRSIRIWDTKTFQTVFILSGHSQAVLCAKYSPDGKTIISGSDDTTARLWAAETGEPLAVVLDGHTASVTAVAYSPDSRRVFTGSKDMSAKLWDPETGKEILTLSGHTQEITTVAVSPSGDTVLTASRDGTAILWPSVPWNGHDGQAVRLVINKEHR